MKEYVALRGEVERDEAGTALFAAVGNHRGGKRLRRRSIRVQTDRHLRRVGLKRPGISNHALRPRRESWDICTPATCAQYRTFWATPTRA